MKESLDRRFAYSHLEWEYSWRGLTWTHILLGCLAPTAVFFGINIVAREIWPEIPFITWIFPSLACCVALLALQYKKDPKFIVRQFYRLVQPKSFTPFKVKEHPPFPIPQEMFDE